MSYLPEPSASSQSIATPCRVVFGAAAAGISRDATARRLDVALPVLAGDGSELLLDAVETETAREDWLLLGGNGRTVGLAVASAGVDLESAARTLGCISKLTPEESIFDGADFWAGLLR